MSARQSVKQGTFLYYPWSADVDLGAMPSCPVRSTRNGPAICTSRGTFPTVSARTSLLPG